MPYRYLHFSSGVALTARHEKKPIRLPLFLDLGAQAPEGMRLLDEAIALLTPQPRRSAVKFLDFLLFIESCAHEARSASGDGRLQIVLSHIESHLSTGITLGAAAKLAGVSPDHLNRLWRGRFGDTVMQYVRTLRLNHAAWQIRNGTKPVRWIAAESGYHDLQVFNKAFRARFRLSPRGYRSSMA
jgi:transcriptional regulator GlxA family with amidase domain